MSDTWEFKHVSGPVGNGSKVQVGIEGITLIGVPDKLDPLVEFLGHETAEKFLIRSTTLDYQSKIRGELAAIYRALSVSDREALPEFETKRSGKIVNMGKFRTEVDAALAIWKPGMRSGRNGGQLLSETRKENEALKAQAAEMQAQMAALQEQLAKVLETQSETTEKAKPKTKAKAVKA